MLSWNTHPEAQARVLTSGTDGCAMTLAPISWWLHHASGSRFQHTASGTHLKTDGYDTASRLTWLSVCVPARA